MGFRGNLVPGQSLGGVVAPIVGAYSNYASEVTQISESSCSIITYLPIRAENPCGHCQPCRLIPRKGGRLEVVIGYEEQRNLAYKAASEKRCMPLHRQCTRLLSAYKSHFPQHSSLLGQGSLCGEREKHTLKRSRVSLSPTLRVFPAAT